MGTDAKDPADGTSDYWGADDSSRRHIHGARRQPNIFWLAPDPCNCVRAAGLPNRGTMVRSGNRRRAVWHKVNAQ